jgi:hypothetical protein
MNQGMRYTSSTLPLFTNARSNLLQTILEKIRLRWEGSLSLPPSEIFSTIGDLTFLQLSTLRHRGAFSTVSLTFTKCCVLTQLEPKVSSSSQKRLETWYQVGHKLAYNILHFLTLPGLAAVHSRANIYYQKIRRNSCVVYCYYVSPGNCALI